MPLHSCKWVQSETFPLSLWERGGVRGSGQMVTISAGDFSESYLAQVSFTNEDNVADWEFVDVSVIGRW